jgi:hypothetical protein
MLIKIIRWCTVGVEVKREVNSWNSLPTMLCYRQSRSVSPFLPNDGSTLYVGSESAAVWYTVVCSDTKALV